MTVIQTEVFEAFRAIDILEDKALKAAAALSKRDDDFASLKTDTAILKWMMGFVLAFQAGGARSCLCIDNKGRTRRRGG
jgi:hypothetical protein